MHWLHLTFSDVRDAIKTAVRLMQMTNHYLQVVKQAHWTRKKSLHCFHRLWISIGIHTVTRKEVKLNKTLHLTLPHWSLQYVLTWKLLIIAPGVILPEAFQALLSLEEIWSSHSKNVRENQIILPFYISWILHILSNQQCIICTWCEFKKKKPTKLQATKKFIS